MASEIVLELTAGADQDIFTVRVIQAPSGIGGLQGRDGELLVVDEGGLEPAGDPGCQTVVGRESCRTC